jgi:signal peptidase I
MTGEEGTATSPEPGGHLTDGPAREPRAGTAGTDAKRRSFWREVPVLIVVALVIAMVIKMFVVQAFFIPTGSMQDTLAIGDKVLVSKLIYHLRPIHPGDIIVFNGAGSWEAPTTAPTSSDPVVAAYDDTLLRLFRSIGGLFGTAPGQTDFIKRVIGVPGDHVACCNAQGLVTINGVALNEKSYLFPGDTPGEAPLGESGRFSLTVPPGRLWVLGDHRAISDDSRGHVDDPGNGTIPANEVIGRAFLIVWPPSQWRVLPIPATFLQAGVVAAAARPAPDRPRTAAVPVSAGLPDGRLRPAPPYLPLAGGFAAAVPLTFLRRRLRLRRRPPRLRRRPPRLRRPAARRRPN